MWDTVNTFAASDTDIPEIQAALLGSLRKFS